MRAHEAVRRTLIHLQCCVLYQLRLPPCAERDRNDLIVVTLNDQRRDIDLREVSCLVRLREGFDTVIQCDEPALHTEPPELVANALAHFGTSSVGAIELR